MVIMVYDLNFIYTSMGNFVCKIQKSLFSGFFGHYYQNETNIRITKNPALHFFARKAP